MTTTQTIALTAGAVLAYSLFRKSQALGTINFYPASVKDITFTNGAPTMTLGLAAQNTSNQDFTLNSIAGNLFVVLPERKHLIGNLSNFTPQTIRRNSQQTINLQIRLSLIGIVTDVIRAFSTNNFSHDLLLEMYANIDNLQIPISLNYKVG